MFPWILNNQPFLIRSVHKSLYLEDYKEAVFVSQQLLKSLLYMQSDVTRVLSSLLIHHALKNLQRIRKFCIIMMGYSDCHFYEIPKLSLR